MCDLDLMPEGVAQAQDSVSMQSVEAPRGHTSMEGPLRVLYCAGRATEAGWTSNRTVLAPSSPPIIDPLAH